MAIFTKKNISSRTVLKRISQGPFLSISRLVFSTLREFWHWYSCREPRPYGHGRGRFFSKLHGLHFENNRVILKLPRHPILPAGKSLLFHPSYLPARECESKALSLSFLL